MAESNNDGDDYDRFVAEEQTNREADQTHANGWTPMPQIHPLMAADPDEDIEVASPQYDRGEFDTMGASSPGVDWSSGAFEELAGDTTAFGEHFEDHSTGVMERRQVAKRASMHPDLRALTAKLVLRHVARLSGDARIKSKRHVPGELPFVPVDEDGSFMLPASARIPLHKPPSIPMLPPGVGPVKPKGILGDGYFWPEAVGIPGVTGPSSNGPDSDDDLPDGDSDLANILTSLFSGLFGDAAGDGEDKPFGSFSLGNFTLRDPAAGPANLNYNDGDPGPQSDGTTNLGQPAPTPIGTKSLLNDAEDAIAGAASNYTPGPPSVRSDNSTTIVPFNTGSLLGGGLVPGNSVPGDVVNKIMNAVQSAIEQSRPGPHEVGKGGNDPGPDGGAGGGANPSLQPTASFINAMKALSALSGVAPPTDTGGDVRDSTSFQLRVGENSNNTKSGGGSGGFDPTTEGMDPGVRANVGSNKLGGYSQDPELVKGPQSPYAMSQSEEGALVAHLLAFAGASK